MLYFLKSHKIILIIGKISKDLELYLIWLTVQSVEMFLIHILITKRATPVERMHSISKNLIRLLASDSYFLP